MVAMGLCVAAAAMVMLSLECVGVALVFFGDRGLAARLGSQITQRTWTRRSQKMSLLWGLKFLRFPECDFKNLGALVAAAARLSAVVSHAGYWRRTSGDLLCNENAHPTEVVVVAETLHEKNTRQRAND
jgi:hypothetical protein